VRVFFRGDLYSPSSIAYSSAPIAFAKPLIEDGANIGFWSSVFTNCEGGISRVVAVEASPSTYRALARTAALCGGRFITEHRARSKSPGTVRFEQGVAHAIWHIVRDGEPVGATERPRYRRGHHDRRPSSSDIGSMRRD
jgi:hypothetical protein